MAVTVIERPYRFSFSGNEIRYIFNLDNPVDVGCALEVRLFVQDVKRVTSPELVASITLHPTSNGFITLQLQDYLAAMVKPQLPAMGGVSLQEADDQIKLYFISYRGVTTAAPAPEWDNEIKKKFVLFGGIEKSLFKRNNFFYSYVPTAKCFMTWMPSRSFVCMDQPVFVTFFNYVAPVDDFVVQLKTYLADGTVNTQEINSPSGLKKLQLLWHIDVSPAAWGLDAMTNVHYYEVAIKDGAGAYIVNPYRFYIDYNPYYSFWDFNYFNSLGGIDNIRIKGEVAIAVETTGEENEHVIYNDTFDTDRPTAQYTMANVLKRDSFKGDAGFQRTKLHQDALIDLLMNKGIFEQLDGRWIRINGLKKSIDLRSTADKKWSYPVEWTYGYDDSAYTPKHIGLGEGTALDEPYSGGGAALIKYPLCKYDSVIATKVWYDLVWVNEGFVPTSISLFFSFDNVTWTAITMITGVGAAHYKYSIDDTFARYHYVRIVPDFNYSLAIQFYYSWEYLTTYTITGLGSTGFTIETTIGTLTGANYDVSIDDGATYAYTNVTAATLAITGLTSGTLYKLVRRMNSSTGVSQVLPPITVITL